jgi:hypothetical protein
MPFSLSSYLLGVGTVVGALIFGFGGGVMLTHTALKESPTEPTRVERVARAQPEPAAPPQAANTQAAAQPMAAAQPTAPDQPVAAPQARTPDQDHPSVAAIKQDTPSPEQPAAVHPGPGLAAQSETPKPDATANALADAPPKTETARQPEPVKQAAKEPQAPKQVEPAERAEPKPADSRATDRRSSKRYAERRLREIVAHPTRPRRYEIQEEPVQEIVVSRPPEPHFGLFGGFFGRPADRDD